MLALLDTLIQGDTCKRYTVYLHAAHADHDIGNPNPRLICL